MLEKFLFYKRNLHKGNITACLIEDCLQKIYKVYSNNTSILKDCPIQIFYAPDPYGEMTAEYIFNKLGHIIELDEIYKLNYEEEFVFVGRFPPAVEKKVSYFKFPKLNFLERILPAPELSDRGTRIYDYFSYLKK